MKIPLTQIRFLYRARDQFGKVVLKPDQEITDAELIEHCKKHLAGFKVPQGIDFSDSLPKGGTGKILKRELREPYWKGHAKRVH